jgi:deazaflavin-dependent oxidoreductase (nitroreductase family)
MLGRAIQKVAGSRAFAKVGPRVAPHVDRLVYRVTGGRYMASTGMLPMIMLTATGARSGQPRTTPLAAVMLDGEFVVVASNFGQAAHPAWSANLIAHPDARIAHRGEEIDVTAHLLTDEDKARVWPRLVEMWPLFDDYAERSGRDLRVFRLTRAGRPTE